MPQVRDGVPSRVTLLHSCTEVRAAIKLSFKMVSGVTPDIHVLDGVLSASSGRGEFWGGLPPLAQCFQCRVHRMWCHLACRVYYDKICIKFPSHHFFLYEVYICENSLNFTYAFKC